MGALPEATARPTAGGWDSHPGLLSVDQLDREDKALPTADTDRAGLRMTEAASAQAYAGRPTLG